jgi:hypothetical protein
MKQSIWLTNALEKLNVTVTNAAMCCYNKATIDIGYNHKIGDLSKHIYVIYHLVRENVESGRFLVFRLNGMKIWAISVLRNFRRSLYGNFGLQLWIQNKGECYNLEDIFLRYYILRILIVYFIISSSCTQCMFLIQGEYCVAVYVFQQY